MAFEKRDINEIIDAMIVDLQSRPELWDVNDNDPEKLSNPSNASIWYNNLGLYATSADIVESQMIDLQADVEARAKQIPVGTDIWRQAETLGFQYGDSLILVDGIPQYATIDETKQIVKYASVTTQSGVILIKAAADDGSGNPIKLTAPQISSLTEYWVNKRFSGESINIISQDGDVAQIFARIEVDGQFISSTGESTTVAGVYPVEDAVIGYIASLDFNGRFLVMGLIDAIQAVSGVSNVVVSQVLAKQDGGASYTDITTSVDKAYIAVAGYMVEDPANIFRNTITYVV